MNRAKQRVEIVASTNDKRKKSSKKNRPKNLTYKRRKIEEHVEVENQSGDGENKNSAKDEEKGEGRFSKHTR